MFTYSPVLKKLCDGTALVPGPGRHQFSFVCAMEPALAEAAADK